MFSEVLSADTKGEDKQDILAVLKRNSSESHRVLFATPVAGTGLNVSKHSCQACYGYFVTNQNTVEDCLQHIIRVRNLTEYHLFIEPRTDSLPVNSGEIRRRLYDLEAMERKSEKDNKPEILHTDYMTGRQNVASDLLMGVYCDSMALANQSHNTFKGRFIERLNVDGFDVIEINSDEDEIKALVAQKKAEEIERIDSLADAVHAAPLLSDTEYEQGKTEKNLHSWVKTHVVKCLGEVIPKGDNETITRYALAEIENGYLSETLKRLASIIDDTFLERQSDWIDDNKQELPDKSFPKQVRRHTIKILSYAGISPLLDYDGTKWRDGYIKNFHQYLSKNKEALVDLKLVTAGQMKKALQKNGNTGATLTAIIKRLCSKDWVRVTQNTIATSQGKRGERLREYDIKSEFLAQDRINANQVIKAKVDL